MKEATYCYGDHVRVHGKNHFLRNHIGSTGVVVGGSGDDLRVFDIQLDFPQPGKEKLKAVPASNLEKVLR